MSPLSSSHWVLMCKMALKVASTIQKQRIKYFPSTHMHSHRHMCMHVRIHTHTVPRRFHFLFDTRKQSFMSVSLSLYIYCHRDEWRTELYAEISLGLEVYSHICHTADLPESPGNLRTVSFMCMSQFKLLNEYTFTVPKLI